MLANISLAQTDSDVNNRTDIALVESIYIHTNASLVFSGEYLYYSIYCFDTTTKKLSNLSKMAYVELISSSGERVFRHKIRLEKGRGYSDFFVPVDLQTGNYKLIGYTNWMQNTDLNFFGNVEINIINPYKVTLDETSIVSNSIVNSNQRDSFNKVNVKDNQIVLELDKANFKSREKAVISISTKDINENGFNGSYSLSVKRKSTIPQPKSLSSISYLNTLKPEFVRISNLDNNAKLPELRGELFKGIIKGLDNTFAQGLNISISFPNETNLLRIARVNANGEFYFNVNSFYFTEEVYFQIIEKNIQDYSIELKPKNQPDLSRLEFNEFSSKPEWKEEIINQSIYNQIENAYFEFRSDSLYIGNKKDLLEGKDYELYNLEDYNRFPTLKETIKEFVSKISVRRDVNLGEVFEIQGLGFDTKTGIRPLVLMDGILVDDHNKLMDYNANYIKEIKIYRNQLVIDLQEFQGAMVINTIEGFDKNEFLQNGFFNQQKIETPQFQKTYYLQKYDESNRSSRLPDYRQQLLWMPNINVMETNNLEIEFYTSDVKGDFEIRLEGFTDEGMPVSIMKEFKVN